MLGSYDKISNSYQYIDKRLRISFDTEDAAGPEFRVILLIKGEFFNQERNNQ
jgi:hypothetical protein